MKYYKILLITLFSGLLFTSCSDDTAEFEEPREPTVPAERLEVENFMYRVMSDIYLYKADVAVLADDYFPTINAKNEYLNGFSSPEKLFDDGLTASQDRFSYVIENYQEMQRMMSGSTTTTGMSYGLVSYCSGCTEVFGYVRLVMPNTSADTQGVERGMIFTRVDGQQLTTSNFRTLLAPSSFTIGLAKIEGNTISELDQTISLTMQEYIHNPVDDPKILDINGRKVGYLYYDSFVADFDEELNDAFGQFLAAGIEDLVLDLRYNGGGSVRTATDLAAMVTGQFPGQVFMKEQWNEKYQKYYEEREPQNLLNNFNTTLRTGTAINSLNLNRVFVLTTKASASASELIINGLEPYIEVIHIGDVTTGKFQASVALYDSPNYSRDHSQLNTSHTYAVQPLVLKSLNANDVSDYVNGLTPDIKLLEDVRNLGVLGDPQEPLLNIALDVIQGNRTSVPEVIAYPWVGENDMFRPDYQQMYIDNKSLIPIKD